MNYFPSTELLGACLDAGTKINPPHLQGACAGGSGTEIAIFLGIGMAGLLLFASVVAACIYACFRIIPRYRVRGNEWARKEAFQAGMRAIAFIFILGIFSIVFF